LIILNHIVYLPVLPYFISVLFIFRKKTSHTYQGDEDQIDEP